MEISFLQQSTLGESLQCPVCFELFANRIYQCSEGHSVCEKCRSQLHDGKCPQCRCSYTGTRNYLLENIVQQLKLIKKDKAPTVIKQIVDAIPSNASSVENLSAPIANADRNIAEIPFIGHRLAQPSGLFNCRVCTAKMPICRMLNHVRSLHRPELFEVIDIFDVLVTK